MSGECQVNVKSNSELDIGGRETCAKASFSHLEILLGEDQSEGSIHVSRDLD